MKVILKNQFAEIVEKKSQFIANVIYVKSEEEINEKIAEIKKKYYDARHNCYAYRVGVDNMIEKSSDDGEPSGTAGHPMFDIIKGNDLVNCLAVVTRYFGGTLLGTGGLVRAYSESLKQALSKTSFAEISYGYYVSFELDYETYGKFEYLVSNFNNINCIIENNKTDNLLIEINKKFEAKINLQYLVKAEAFEKFDKEMINLSKGKISFDKSNEKRFYINDKKVVYL